MSKILTIEQREQAGSDSYNRFEYQVHWIVCHIIGKLQEDTGCVVICEFHDDMPSNFDSVFDEFIQRTFVHKSELQLTTYETQTMGEFFNHLADKNIPSNTANLIFQQLLNATNTALRSLWRRLQARNSLSLIYPLMSS